MPTERSIPEIVDELFTTRRHPSGREYGYTEIANDLRDRFGINIDPGVLRRVRIGETPNPTASTIRAFILFFGVPASVFFPGPDMIEKPAMPTDDLSVRLRALGMTETDREDLLKLMGRLLMNKRQYMTVLVSACYLVAIAFGLFTTRQK